MSALVFNDTVNPGEHEVRVEAEPGASGTVTSMIASEHSRNGSLALTTDDAKRLSQEIKAATGKTPEPAKHRFQLYFARIDEHATPVLACNQSQPIRSFINDDRSATDFTVWDAHAKRRLDPRHFEDHVYDA